MTEENKKYPQSWILLLALLTAIAPLSTDMYLPALPNMASEYSVSTLLISSTLPAYFLGLAIGQLIYGPISDRIGRKKPLIFGLTLHVVASLLCIFTQDLDSLLIVRTLQALGSCVGLVLARAAIRDVLDTKSSARAFSSMMIVMGIAPVIAPTLGAWLLLIFHWHSIFIALALLGFIALIWVILGFEETLEEQNRLNISISNVFNLYLNIFKESHFRLAMLAGCFSFGILFCYINLASTILMESFHLNEQQFAYVFGINAVGTMSVSAMNHKLERKFSILQRLRLGGLLQMIGVLILLSTTLFHNSFLMILIGLFLSVSAIGLTAPNSTALAMSQQGRQAGSASALMGSVQFSFGLISGVLLNLLPWNALFNLSMVMFIFVLLSNLFIQASIKYSTARSIA